MYIYYLKGIKSILPEYEIMLEKEGANKKTTFTIEEERDVTRPK